MLENNCQYFSWIDTNGGASYKLWSINKYKWLKTVIKSHIGWENYIFDDYKLIEYKWNYIRNYLSHYQSLL